MLRQTSAGSAKSSSSARWRPDDGLMRPLLRSEASELVRPTSRTLPWSVWGFVRGLFVAPGTQDRQQVKEGEGRFLEGGQRAAPALASFVDSSLHKEFLCWGCVAVRILWEHLSVLFFPSVRLPEGTLDVVLRTPLSWRRCRSLLAWIQDTSRLWDLGPSLAVHVILRTKARSILSTFLAFVVLPPDHFSTYVSVHVSLEFFLRIVWCCRSIGRYMCWAGHGGH
jgi:hypothetical protein